MAFGDLTYPSRVGVPNSSVVDYMPDPNAWGTDWSQREMATQARPAMTFDQLLAQQVNDYAKSSNVTGYYDPRTGTNTPGKGASTPAIQSAYDFANTAFKDPTGAFLSGNAPGTTLPAGSPTNRDAATALFGADFYPTLSAWNYTDSPSYKQAQLQKLQEEKSRMTPILSAQHLAQTAYDNMLGNGQQNGIMSADYSSPDFGRITGDFGQNALGTAGFGAPNLPTGALPSTVWGAAPRRATPWSL